MYTCTVNFKRALPQPKEPCRLSKEPYLLPKEAYLLTGVHLHGDFENCSAPIKRALFSAQKGHIFSSVYTYTITFKRALPQSKELCFNQKSLMFCQKSPIFCQKRPHLLISVHLHYDFQKSTVSIERALLQPKEP